MSTKPKISFVVPAHNEENYIGACLDAILKEVSREGCPAEIIVVNNNSTDKTTGVVQKYGTVKLVNEPIKGLTRARQRGFLEASGELVANIDADIVLPVGWLKKTLKEFHKNPKLVCLSGPQIFGDASKSLKFMILPYYAFMYFTYVGGRYFIRRASLVQGGNFVLKREALRRLGGFNHHFNFYGEDTDIALRLHKVGAVKFTLGLPVISSARRLNKEGLLTMAWRYSAEYFWVITFGKPLHKNYLADVQLGRGEKAKLKLFSFKDVKNLKKVKKLVEFFE